MTDILVTAKQMTVYKGGKKICNKFICNVEIAVPKNFKKEKTQFY